MPEIVIQAREASISSGLVVRRILPFRQRRMVGPFIFLDHAGPIEINPTTISEMDVLPHPHIGLATVTYLLGGEVTHRDSLGVQQIIKPGEVNWMTAGSGISHSERFEQQNSLAGKHLEMLQSWVALPEEKEEITPEFENYKTETLPTHTDKGVWIRLIAGEAFGLKSKVKTYSPLFYLHVQLEKGAQIGIPDNYSERAIYVVNGSIQIGQQTYQPGQMVVFSKVESPIITTHETATFMMLGGEPLGHRYIYWNFVSSRKDRIEQAKADWEQGRIILPQLDNEEFVPLPQNLGNLAHKKEDDNPEPGLLS